MYIAKTQIAAIKNDKNIRTTYYKKKVEEVLPDYEKCSEKSVTFTRNEVDR